MSAIIPSNIVMSGIRPTGMVHLGNYFGAIRNYVKMQDEFECYFMVADLHSLTTHPETAELKGNVRRVLAENIACGLDPNKATFYCQSHIYETGELYLYLNMLAYKGELEKTVTFKDKARQHPENINAGLLTYPVLQTADIIMHRASHVPVGKDQEQHLEMARNFVVRFNHRYGEIFPEPRAFNYNQELIKVPGLDGSGKMSKSENNMSTLYFADDNDTIKKKVMKALTDGGPTEMNSKKPDYIENIFALMKLVCATEVIEKVEADFNNCTISGKGQWLRRLSEGRGREPLDAATARHKQRHSTATDRDQHFTSFPHVPLHLIAYEPRMTNPTGLKIGKTCAAARVRKASTIVISGI